MASHKRISVIPMGWLSATGIKQHLAYRPTGELGARLGPRADTAEVSRGTRPSFGLERRPGYWPGTCLDDNSVGELVSHAEIMAKAGTRRPFQLLLHEVTASGAFQAPRLNKTSVVHLPCWGAGPSCSESVAPRPRRATRPQSSSAARGTCWASHRCGDSASRSWSGSWGSYCSSSAPPFFGLGGIW